MKKIIVILFWCVMCCFCGCGQKREYMYDESVETTTCGNITMGQGKFAYSDDFIYYAGIDKFYEYDMLSKKTVTFSEEDVVFPDNIYIEGEHIYFANGGLKRITRDGKKLETVYDNTKGDLQLYVDDTKSYFMDSLDGTLYCRDLESEQEEALLSGMLSYHVESDYIYAVAKDNDLRQLYKSSVDEISFEPVTLGFEPITVFATKDALYLAKKSTYELVQYKDSVETALPVFSTYYQVIDDNLIYLDENTYENGCFDLKIYTLDTGEQIMICEDVYNFCVLLDRYIAIERYDANFLYDIEEETLELMYELEE